MATTPTSNPYQSAIQRRTIGANYTPPTYDPQQYTVKPSQFEQDYTARVQAGQAGFGTPVEGPKAYNIQTPQFEQQYMANLRQGQVGFGQQLPDAIAQGAPTDDIYAQQQYEILRQQAVQRQQQMAQQQQEALQRRLAAGGIYAGSGALEAQQAELAQQLQQQAGTELAGLDVAQLQAAEQRAAQERQYQVQATMQQAEYQNQAEQMALQMGYNREEARRLGYQWSQEMQQKAQMQEREMQFNAEQQLLDMGYNREEANRLASQFTEQLRADWNKQLADQSWRSAEALADRDLKQQMEIIGAELSRETTAFEDAIEANRAIADQQREAWFNMGASGMAIDPTTLPPQGQVAYAAGQASAELERVTNQRELEFGVDKTVLEQQSAAYYAMGQAGQPLDTDDPLAVAAYNKGQADQAVARQTQKQELMDQVYGELISSLTYAINEDGQVDFNKYNSIRNQILKAATEFGYIADPTQTPFTPGTLPTEQPPQSPEPPQTPEPPQPPPPPEPPQTPTLGKLGADDVQPTGMQFVPVSGGPLDASFGAAPGDMVTGSEYQPLQYRGGGNWEPTSLESNKLPQDAQLVVQTVELSPEQYQERINQVKDQDNYAVPLYTAIDANTGQKYQYVTGKHTNKRENRQWWFQEWRPVEG